MPYSKQYTIALTTSALTSAPFLVTDWRQIGVQTSASNVTVYGADVDGFGAAIASGDWSALTGISTAGAYTVEAGIRWLRFESASTATVQLVGRS